MIERNTTIPAKKSQIFSTASDSQPAVDIRICQGERPMFSDNKLLGNFKLDGIAPARRGEPQIEVTFDIDANGILHVSAKDKQSGKEQKISIQGSSGLSKDEIEQAKRDAESHAEEDKKRVEKVDAKNKADNLVFSVEKQLGELGDNAPAELKEMLNGKIQAVKDAISSDDVDKINKCRFRTRSPHSKPSPKLPSTPKPEPPRNPTSNPPRSPPPTSRNKPKARSSTPKSWIDRSSGDHRSPRFDSSLMYPTRGDQRSPLRVRS